MDNLEIYPDIDQLSWRAAQLFVQLARQSVEKKGRFCVALSGGSTPLLTYTLLARQPLADQVKWNGVHLFWGDERCVPPDHPMSNYGQVERALIRHVNIPSENIHRMHGELAPIDSARHYEMEIRRFFGTGGQQPPALDLFLLGLGEDGHTASLFPGSPALEEQDRWVLAVRRPEDGSWRLTMTFPLLNAANTVVFLVSGDKKATILRRALQSQHKTDVLLPVQKVLPATGRLIWMTDASSAAGLR